MLKSHEYPTQPLAWTLDREFSGIDVYGGVALDWGRGLNPEAAQGEDGKEAWPDLLRQVRGVGPEPVVLSSDHGQASNPEPAAALAVSAERLVEAGFSEAEVRRMLSEDPQELLTG